MKRLALIAIAFICAASLSTAIYANKQHIMEMSGALLIEGYDFKKDTGPKGSISYNPESNEFRGGYRGLKVPEGQTAVFAWLHDTVNQTSTFLGPVKPMKAGAANKGKFTIKAPDEFKGGNFGSNEIIGFTAESSQYVDGKKLSGAPDSPSGTKTVPAPAFYMFAALPGADTERHFCGHGKDFFYAKAPEKQTCYDCICKQKYSACIKAGMGYHKIKS